MDDYKERPVMSGEAILGTSAEDTTMTDIGERVRPPDPSDVGGS